MRLAHFTLIHLLWARILCQQIWTLLPPLREMLPLIDNKSLENIVIIVAVLMDIPLPEAWLFTIVCKGHGESIVFRSRNARGIAETC